MITKMPFLFLRAASFLCKKASKNQTVLRLFPANQIASIPNFFPYFLFCCVLLDFVLELRRAAARLRLPRCFVFCGLYLLQIAAGRIHKEGNTMKNFGKRFAKSILSLALALAMALAPALGVSAATVESLPAGNTTAVTAVQTKSTTVWIPTNGGKKYHSKSTCSNMKNPKKVTLSEAQKEGFTACKKCYK
jgi:hypothetical protein